DGSKIGFARQTKNGSGLYTMNPDGSSATQVTPGPGDTDPAVSPPLSPPSGTGGAAAVTPSVNPVYLGTNGIFGNAAGGFLFGEQNKRVTSMVVFDATTRSTLTLTSQTGLNPGLPNLVFAISCDTLTMLAFVNGNGAPAFILGTPPGAQNPIPAPSPAPNAALVTFDAMDGTVTAIIPYSVTKAVGAALKPSKQGSALVYHGAFRGVWDASGKNLAPQGATEVRIDALTGKLISYR
ncbi:MAG TPA: hypothetical protein VKU00_10620, partial [Chthonomonadaceae bacterium]|nr:hypothetical protein [Chthonomonadaceae bacterium]